MFKLSLRVFQVLIDLIQNDLWCVLHGGTVVKCTARVAGWSGKCLSYIQSLLGRGESKQTFWKRWNDSSKRIKTVLSWKRIETTLSRSSFKRVYVETTLYRVTCLERVKTTLFKVSFWGKKKRLLQSGRIDSCFYSALPKIPGPGLLRANVDSCSDAIFKRYKNNWCCVSNDNVYSTHAQTV